MSIRSNKAKGRRLQNYVKEKLREIGKTFGLIEEDINSSLMSQVGVDIILSPAAKNIFPFDIECKNTEKINIWKAIEQAEKNSKDGRIPLVIFSKNFAKKYAVIEFEKLLELLYSKK